MNKKGHPGMKNRTMFFVFIALFIIIVSVVAILFLPNMSATLINTVPEYPPEFHPFQPAETVVAEAVTVDKTNVKAIVNAIKRPEEYFSKTQSILSHNSGSASFARQKWVKGSLSRVDVFSSVSSQTPSAHYIYTDKFVYAWKPEERTAHKSTRGSFNPDDDQMMISYEDITSVEDEDIITAQLTVYDGTSCIYAEVRNPSSGYTNRYWISYSTGLLVFGQSLNPEGKVVYSVTSTQTDISPQNMETFLLPNGELPQ